MRYIAPTIATTGRAYGWLYLVNKPGMQNFSEVDEQVIATVATQLAIAYENLALYEEVQRSQNRLKTEIIERIHVQDSLRRTLRARTVMAKCNHVMVHASDEVFLLHDMCRTVVEAGGYYMVWIGYARDDGAAITRSVIALGRSLNLRVIAEGVETEEQLDFLRRHQCDEMQGHYFSKALAADDFTSLLRSGSQLYN